MAPQGDLLVGRLAAERGYIDQSQLNEALRNQRSMEEMGVHEDLGQILLATSRIDTDELQDLRNAVAVTTGDAFRIGNYRVLEKLGQGGFGAVFRAENVETRELVALKVLPPSMADDRHIERFKREAAIVEQLDHENIVGIVEFGFDHNRECYFCALELVEGETALRRAERHQWIPENEVVTIALQIAMALQHAHFNHLVHRDVKPDNIMLARDGTAKLLDLGLARPVGKRQTRLTQSGAFAGSAHYASPEQARGKVDLDIRSDIYSLGATLYHLATRRPPFEAESFLMLVQMQVYERAPWPADIRPELSDGFCRVVARMMAKEPGDRYKSPVKLLDDLYRLAKRQIPNVPDHVLQDSSIAPSSRRPKRDNARSTTVRMRPVASMPRERAIFYVLAVGGPAVLVIVTFLIGGIRGCGGSSSHGDAGRGPSAANTGGLAADRLWRELDSVWKMFDDFEANHPRIHTQLAGILQRPSLRAHAKRRALRMLEEYRSRCDALADRLLPMVVEKALASAESGDFQEARGRMELFVSCLAESRWMKGVGAAKTAVARRQVEEWCRRAEHGALKGIQDLIQKGRGKEARTHLVPLDQWSGATRHLAESLLRAADSATGTPADSP